MRSIRSGVPIVDPVRPGRRLRKIRGLRGEGHTPTVRRAATASPGIKHSVTIASPIFPPDLFGGKRRCKRGQLSRSTERSWACDFRQVGGCRFVPVSTSGFDLADFRASRSRWRFGHSIRGQSLPLRSPVFQSCAAIATPNLRPPAFTRTSPAAAKRLRCRTFDGRSPRGDCRRHKSKDAGCELRRFVSDQILAIGRGRRGCCETVATGRGGCSGNRSRSPPRNGDIATVESRSATSDRATDRYGGSAKPRRGQVRHAGCAIPLSSSGGNTAAFGRGTAAHGREAASCSQGQAKSDRECAGRERVGRVPLTSQHL